MRNRLILSFITLLIVMSVSSYLSVLYFDRTAKELQTLVQDQTRRTILAQRASQQSQMAANLLLQLLQTEEQEDRKPLYRSMDKALAMSDAAVRTLAKEPEQVEVSRLTELRERYGELFQVTVETIEFDGLEPAKVHFNRETNRALYDLLDETERVSVSQQDSMLESEKQLQAKAESVKMIIVYSELALLTLSLLLALRIANSFSKQIDDSIEIADQIASGDYSEQPNTASAPEMIKLHNALDQMRESILSRESHIKQIAYEDSVTALGNRNRFFETLSRCISDESGAVFLVDINRFSQINRALGHATGDLVLREVGGKLAKCLSKDDLISRIEGNKFALLIRNIEDEETLDQAIARLLESVTEPIEIQGQSLDIDISAGIIRFPDTTKDIDTLIRSAEAALISAKRKKETFHVAHHPISADDEHHLSLLGELRIALEQGQFHLLYQPKLDLRTREVKSVEALVRWHHPEKGLIRPDLFIPFAEQTGFIKEITPWVIQQALKDAATWLAAGLNLSVSVNMSAIDLTSPALIPAIRDALEQHPIPISKLCLEVTESALMDDPESSFKRVSALRDLGVTLSMDDYGTGQASLAYVRDLPVNELKIDRSFVTDINANSKNAAIVWSTLLLCRELGISVVAEGVETDEELVWLAEHDCNLIQGYRLSRPIPLDQLLEFQPDPGLITHKD